MTDGGDVAYGMVGEENVGAKGTKRSGCRRDTLLVPMIHEDDEDTVSPNKGMVEEEIKENWEHLEKIKQIEIEDLEEDDSNTQL